MNEPRLVRDYELEEVFQDKALAARFNNDLVRLLSEVQQTKVSPFRALSSVEKVSGSSDSDRWGDFIEAASRTLGPSLTQVVFPGAVVGLVDSRVSAWSIGGVDDSEVTEDEDETVLDDVEVARIRAVPPSQRTQYRSWARRWVRVICGEHPPALTLRMTIACLYLDLLAAGVWGVDESWRSDVRDLVGALVPSKEEQDETPNRGMAYLSSLIAVCLAMLLQNASLHGGAERDVIAKAAWDHGHEWAAFAEEQIVDAFVHSSAQADARVVTTTEVRDVVELAMTAADDPHAEALATLEAEGITAQRIDGVWVVDGTFRNPLRVAARAVTVIGGGCVLARNTRQSTVLIWHGTTLAMADSKVPRWRIYSVTAPVTPQTKFSGGEGLPPTRDAHPLSPAPDRVRLLAEAVEVALPMLMLALR
jgi:hypothetical protein